MVTLTDNQLEYLNLIRDVKTQYPDWNQRKLISNMRRAIPEYSSGIWSVALPFNRGPSNLSSEMQARILKLRQQSMDTMGVDLARILTALDIRLNFDIVDNAFISWAGDIGSHALRLHVLGVDIPVGDPDSFASMSDLLGDIDGDNIARHARPGQELIDALAYYGLNELPAGMPSVATRYSTFLQNLGLLRDGRLIDDIDSPKGLLYRKAQAFVYWEALEKSLMGHQLSTLVRKALKPGDAPSLEKRIQIAVNEFAAILRAGLAAERDAAAA